MAFTVATGIAHNILAAIRQHKRESHELPWVNAVLLNGWVNYDTASWSIARYCRVGELVFIEGLIKSGTTTSGTVIMQMGTAYAPEKNTILPWAVSHNGASYLTTRLDLDPNGQLIIADAGVGNGFLSIEACYRRKV